MRNWGCRMKTDLHVRGWRAASLENELLRVTVLPEKGSDIIEFLHKPTDMDFCWFTDVGLRRADEARGAHFIDQYAGGWNEVFPNGGPDSEYRGARYTQHQEVAVLPWEAVVAEDTPERVTLQLTVRTVRSPFRAVKRLTLVRGEARLYLEEEITNEGRVEHHAMWGHHLAYGAPFLEPGCRVEMPPGTRVIPHPGGEAVAWPDGAAHDLSIIAERGAPSGICYLQVPEGYYRLVHPGRGLAAEVRWDAGALPYCWFWQEYGATEGYPWYGRHYNIGLEPFSSYPTNGLAEAVQNGSALLFQPGETKRLRLSVSVGLD